MVSALDLFCVVSARGVSGKWWDSSWAWPSFLDWTPFDINFSTRILEDSSRGLQADLKISELGIVGPDFVVRRTCCLYSTSVASQRCLWGNGWCPMLDCSLPFGCSWADWRVPSFNSQSLSWCCQVTPDQCSKMYPLATFQPDMASGHQPCHRSISKLCKVVQSRVMGEAVYGAGWSICFRQATVVTSESPGSTTLWMIELRFSSPPFEAGNIQG